MKNTSEREMASILERFLDLCPRMNDNDPISPALRDCCRDAKQVLSHAGYRGPQTHVTIYEANNGND